MVSDAYWAGLFDGEGCVVISSKTRRNGSIKHAVDFLKTIQPHLLIKSNQCALAIEFQDGIGAEIERREALRNQISSHNYGPNEGRVW